MKKELLKRTVLAIVAVFAFAFSASAEEAKLLSFGFFQANNPGLSKDYVATIPDVTAGKTTYDIEVALPAGTNLTDLVAQFTVNEGNTVAVDGTAQTSGVSQNDFTDPVDYTVSNSNKSSNIRYTVTVVEESAEAKAWTEVAVLNPTAVTGDETVTGVYAGTILKINPKDNLPYVAFGVRGADNKLTVAKFDGSAWSKVGAASFTNKVSGSHYGFDIAIDGTPYVAFNDQEATNKGGISVMKFDGSAWSLVGDAGITATTAQYVGIAAVGNGVIAAQQNNKAGDFAKRAVVASYWNGSTWATEAPFSGLYARQSIISNGKEAYILVVNASKPQDYSIVKTTGVEKSIVVENYLPEGATSGMNTADISLAIAPNGTLYMLAPDDVAGTAKMRLSALKNGAFQTVGGDVIPVSEGAFDRHCIVKAAIAPDGTPFVAYNDNSEDNNIYCIHLDNETNLWSAPVKVASGAGTSPDVNIAFTTTGTGYLSFSDKNSQIHLFTIEVEAPAPAQTPAITFEAPAVERTVTIGMSAIGKKASVDWGDGELVELASTDDGWGGAKDIEFVGTPKGTVKVYGDDIIGFTSFTPYATDATTITNGITSIDLSSAAGLTSLDVHQNNLKSIDLSALTALTSLTAGANDFTTIDLSANTELTKIDLSNVKNNGVLTALDLSKNTKLTTIVASGNQLTTLDLTNNTLAKTITMLNNQLTSVTFGENTAKKHTINLGGNKLTSLDLMQFADASGTYLRVRDNDLTEVKLPVKIGQLWADGNAFTLAQLYALKDMAKTLTYATTYTKENAQAPLAITADGGKVDLSAQAKLGETATVFTWKDAEGTALAEGTDYTVADGVFTFLKSFNGIHCEMTNAELNAFTAEKPYKTTAIDVIASGINDIKAQDGKAQIFNLAGQRVATLKKGINIMNGKKVMVK